MSTTMGSPVHSGMASLPALLPPMSLASAVAPGCASGELTTLPSAGLTCNLLLYTVEFNILESC